MEEKKEYVEPELMDLEDVAGGGDTCITGGGAAAQFAEN